MNNSADYFESLELHPGAVASETPLVASSGANAEPAAETQGPAAEADQHEIAAELGAILHSESLDHVVAEVGAACVTRSDVASAVHAAVTDAVQAAVNGVVAVAVAAAVKANSSMNAEEVEKRFRQKYLGIGTPGSPVAEETFLKPPRLQVEEDGSVALSVDAEAGIVDLSDPDVEAELAEAVSVENDAAEAALLEAMLHETVQSAEPSALAAADTPDIEAESQPSEPETEPAQVESEPVAAEPPLPEEELFAAPEALAPEGDPALPESVIPDPVIPEPQSAVSAQPAVVQAVVAQPPAAQEPVHLAGPVSVEPASVEPVSAGLAVMPAPSRPAMPVHAQEPESIERTLRDEKSIQFVGFQVGTQMYAVPSILIREVIRRQPVSRLPVHSRYAPGVINLRGLVIPLVSLRVLLQADMPQEGSCNQFCIITGTEGMRIALEVDKIRSMYVVPQADIVWNVGSVLGLDDDTVIGLFELEERLVPILSVERVAALLLEEGIDIEGLMA